MHFGLQHQNTQFCREAPLCPKLDRQKMADEQQTPPQPPADKPKGKGMNAPINETGFSTTCCADCMTGPFPDQNMIEDKSLWFGEQPPGCYYMACPCEALVDASEELGFFEEGTSPWLGCSSKPFGAPCARGQACCCLTFWCCLITTAAGPQTPCMLCYIAKMRQKTMEKAGIPPESLGKAFAYSLAPGLAVNQISRELALHKMHPRLKTYTGQVVTYSSIGSPAAQVMDRPV